MIRANKVMVHFKCCKCGAVQKQPLDEVLNMTFTCDKCNKVENYMDVNGVSILKAKRAGK